MSTATFCPSALLWDIDGTLIDTTHLVAAGLDHVYDQFLGKSLPAEELRALIGIPLARQMWALGDPASFGATQSEMEEEFIRFWEAHRHEERLIPDAIRALRAGKHWGLPTALVTSKNAAEIANTLPRMGIDGFVDLVVCADDVKQPKPHPEGVLLAVSRLGLDPSTTVFIGDTIHDMQAGKGAGVRTCAVLWGASTEEALLREQPDLVCRDPLELFMALWLEGEH